MILKPEFYFSKSINPLLTNIWDALILFRFTVL